MYHKVIYLGACFVPTFNYCFFFFIKVVSIHNFADDPLSAWGERVSKLINSLEWERNIAINWFTENEIIISPDHYVVSCVEFR